MLTLMVQCNILNCNQSEGSRASYIIFLITRSSVRTAESIYEPFHVLYAQIHTFIYCYIEFGRTHKFFSNVNIFMTEWKNICSIYEAWKLQHWFGLIFLCVFQPQTLFSIHFLWVRGASTVTEETLSPQYSGQNMNSYTTS